MHIGIYARKSIYSDKSDSIESQIKICKEYSNNNYDISTITIYEDEGFTGANTNRPGFTRLMKDVETKKIDVLICYKIDRISRNVLDFSSTFNKLQENHIEFVSVKEQIDTSTPLGRAMMYICSVFAQMERETIAERVKDNMMELAKSGKWTGGQAPLGYKIERFIIDGKSHSKLIPNECELSLLNLIFDAFLKGHSLSSLERYFQKAGIKSVNGRYLSSTQLYQILNNPHYVAATLEVYEYFESKGCIMDADKTKFDGAHGVIIYGRTSGGRKKTHTVNTADKWIVTVGVHDSIISADKWLSVQSRFGLNKIDKTRKHEIGLLKGIVKCKCGYSMRVKHKVDKIYNRVYDSYYCPNRDRRGIELCDMKMVSVYDIDDSLIDTLKQIKADKNLLPKYMHNPCNDPICRSRDSIRKDISSIDKKIRNLTETLQDNSGSSATKYLISEIERLDEQIVGLNYELREVEMIERDLSIEKNNIDYVYKEICKYLDKYETLSYENKVSFLKDIIKECIWDGVKLFLNF